MEYLKLPLRHTRSPAYIGSEPVQRATWLNLLTFCAEQENGGRILLCREWKDRMWQQLVGVTLEEVQDDSCDLFCWEGDDLVVWGYPADTERRCLEAREAARRGGIASAKARSTDPSSTPSTDPSTVASTAASTKHSKGKDSITKHSKGNGHSPSGCRFLGFEDACDWIDQQNGKIPDPHRARSLARELIDEMQGRSPPWTTGDGQPVGNPIGLLVNRLKRDGAYQP